MLKSEDQLSTNALRVVVMSSVAEEMNRWQQYADCQRQVQCALTSNHYLIYTLQLITRCRRQYRSCDIIDFEVAREGVEFDDEVEDSPHILVGHRLYTMQALTLAEKQAITDHLCLLGLKVTLYKDETGKDEQLKCPLLVDFDVSAPSCPEVDSGYVSHERMTLQSKALQRHFSALRALSVVTDARTFRKLDLLIGDVVKRQSFLEHVSSDLCSLWTLELMVQLRKISPIGDKKKCFYVDQHLVASAGVGLRVDDMEGNVHRASGDEDVGVDSGYDVEDGEGQLAFYGDPLYFSRTSRLQKMTGDWWRAATTLMQQHYDCAVLERGEGSEENDYLFAVLSAASPQR